MIYGIEQSTDLRRPRTEIKKFSSLTSAKKWREVKNGEFTYSDPEGARNYHHTFRYLYELFGRVDKRDSVFKSQGTSTYPKNDKDRMYSYLIKHGEELK